MLRLNPEATFEEFANLTVQEADHYDLGGQAVRERIGRRSVFWSESRALICTWLLRKEVFILRLKGYCAIDRTIPQ